VDKDFYHVLTEVFLKDVFGGLGDIFESVQSFETKIILKNAK